MSEAQPIAIKSTGLVTSVGLSAPATCAAIRAKISNPTETRFMGGDGEWIMAHQVHLEKPWRGLAKLARMAAMAIEECLADVPRDRWFEIPLLLCVAERDRPGRLACLDDCLLREIARDLGAIFAPGSAAIARGCVGVAVALCYARTLIHTHGYPRVLIASADSLLVWETLAHYESRGRLLTNGNSDGFMPGEGAGALLVSRPDDDSSLVWCGIGFGTEHARVDSGEPLRADGLTTAHRNALAEADCEIHDLDFRITDLTGEQYYFKEADLAFSRVLRVRQEDPQLWHPAESTGVAGALLGLLCPAVAQRAFEKGYALGTGVLLHLGNDEGCRATLIGRRRG